MGNTGASTGLVPAGGRAPRRNPAPAKVRMVAVTGYEADKDRCKLEDAVFDGHLTKPAAA